MARARGGNAGGLRQRLRARFQEWVNRRIPPARAVTLPIEVSIGENRIRKAELHYVEKFMLDGTEWEVDHSGIEVIDTRHEAAAVFAADACARLTGVPGVAAVTAGPGLTNTVTAVENARLAQSPVLVLGGAAPTVLRRLPRRHHPNPRNFRNDRDQLPSQHERDRP